MANKKNNEYVSSSTSMNQKLLRTMQFFILYFINIKTAMRNSFYQ